MTDHEINLAVHQEVEGWQPVCGTAYEWVRHVGGKWERMSHEPVPDYCHDAAWCVAMMEKHGMSLSPSGIATAKWSVSKYDETLKHPVQVYDSSLTRAVALAVLQLTREGKS